MICFGNCWSPLVLGLLTLLLAQGTARAQISDNLLKNPSFEEGLAENGLPAGWGAYAGDGVDSRITLVEPGAEGKYAALIEDGDATKEIGLTQQIAAEGGKTYEAAVKVKPAEGATAAGAYLQMRFAPSGEYVQASLMTEAPDEFQEVSAVKTAPEGTESITIYLYTHRDPTPRFIVDSVRVVSGVEPPPPPPPPPPEPIPPQYDKLKDPCIETDLVKDGQAGVTIVAPASGVYDAQASAIAGAIEKLTGVRPPVAKDDSAEAALPSKYNLILLGNRSTNATISNLYNWYYTLLDLRYPGPGGHVVRTLHNPLGDGHNVVFVGGSDDAGVQAATQVFIQKLKEAGGGRGALTIGWMAEIKLGEGIEVPTDVRDMKIWDASKGYGSTGYFGWNSISKHMAAYYMTGREHDAREVLRLAFPDAQALKEIAEIDGERIENKDDPLAGTYHYNSHMMILFWDLIEESPVFSPEERLKVTNAFARQLNHRKNEGVYGLTHPAQYVGSRHGQWSAISLYCLGRYFQKYYPDPIWDQCVRGAEFAFASLKKHAWAAGESDNLFWYNTGTAPILSWMLLSGDRAPLESGSLQTLLRAQEMLISGRVPDWALNSASIGYLHKAAYLTGDGRWIDYRNRTGVDLSVFRLGQSYWPDKSLEPRLPNDLVGRWSINPLPKPMWQARASGLPFEESFQFGSFRSAPDASGDFILLDGYNGASRNPYHCFAVLELRLDGHTLLQGYRNQVVTRADGMVEPKVAMDGALRYRDVLGTTAAAVGEVPNAAFCNWRRSLVQRVGKYALFVDDLTFRTDSDNIQAQTLWETPSATWDAEQNALRITTSGVANVPPGWYSQRALTKNCTSQPAGEGMLAQLDSIGITLLRATEAGQYLEMKFDLPQAVEGDLFADFVNYVDRGRVRLYLDGEPVGDDYDNYAQSVEPGHAPLGRHKLAAGEHRLRVEVVEKHPGLEKCYVGLAGVSIRPEGAPLPNQPGVFEIRPSDLVHASRRGAVSTLEWVGPARKGQHLIFFSLISSRPLDAKQGLACLRLADNAAALALPAPAVAVVGQYEGIAAELAVLAEDHLYARRLTSASVADPLISADAAVDLDWDFATGALQVVAPEDTVLSLRLASVEGLTIDDVPTQAEVAGDLFRLPLSEGRHVLAGAIPVPDAVAQTSERLAALLAEAREQRERLAAERAGAGKLAAPELAEALTGKVGGKVVDLVTIPGDDGQLICAAEGTRVHVLSPEGQEVMTLQTDGDIRMLRWWQEHNLLLVGCADEQVIAFDRSGKRKWVFVSEMDPAVFRAAKTYWFKSAHPGIWGVYSGVFLDGKSQAFVGSACTLEIIDENGKLVHRMPQFWGDPAVFRFVDGPDGSINLLAARRTNGTNRWGIINNETLNPGQRGFYGVPAGSTFVGGWSAQNTHHIFYEDLDGDGVKEVVSDTNGTWNRVTVWDASGKPLHDASFGPGERIQARNMRGLDIADLDGDGKKEIITCTSSGLVVALDCQCGKVWSRRLPSAPNVMKAFALPGADGPWIVVGCDDGTVVALDGTGQVIRLGQVTGRPTRIASLETAAGPVALLATDKGEIEGFRVGE